MPHQIIQWGFTLLVALFLNSCGGRVAGFEDEPQSPAPHLGAAKAVLEVFAGYNCASCNVELPELQSRMAEINERGLVVQVKVYVVSGKNGKKVDQAMANQYAIDLGINFEMVPDHLCRGRYKKYYAGNSCLVPAAVVVPTDSDPIVYAPGKLDMDKFIPELKSIIHE